MKERIKNVVRGQLITSLIYLALGIWLVMFPEDSVNIISKVVFGVVLMLIGLYHIWFYMSEDEGANVFNLFTGAILLVLGVFFFQNPLIVTRILPSLLAALLLVDSIWTLKTGLRWKKYERNEWQFFVIVSLVFVTLGIVVFINPFKDMNHTILFAGGCFIGDAVLDFVSMILAFRGNKAIERGEVSVKKVKKNENKTEAENKTDDKSNVEKVRKSLFSKLRRKDAEIVNSEDADVKEANKDVYSSEGQDVGHVIDLAEKLDAGVEPDKVQGVFKLEEEPDKVQEVFKLEEEPDKVQEVFKLEEEPDKVQEVFKLEEEPDKVQEVFKLEEEPDKVQETFHNKEEKNYLRDLLKLDEGVLEEWKD